MRWEVQYPEPKKPAPFDNWDLIVCGGFAYGFTMAVLNFNIVFFTTYRGEKFQTKGVVSGTYDQSIIEGFYKSSKAN